MGNLKERESRRKASVVGSIIEQQPAEETTQRSSGPVSYTHLDVYKRQVLAAADRRRIGSCGRG